MFLVFCLYIWLLILPEHGFNLGVILGTFIGKFVDPIGYIFAFSLGFILSSHNKIFLIFIALLTGTLINLLLMNLDPTRTFLELGGQSLVIGICANLLHTYIGYKVGSYYKKRKKDISRIESKTKLLESPASLHTTTIKIFFEKILLAIWVTILILYSMGLLQDNFLSF